MYYVVVSLVSLLVGGYLENKLGSTLLTDIKAELTKVETNIKAELGKIKL